MLFIGFFDGFLHHSRQTDKMNLFISAVLLSGQLLNSKQLKPELHCQLSCPSQPRQQPGFSEKRNGTGRLQTSTRSILLTEWIHHLNCDHRKNTSKFQTESIRSKNHGSDSTPRLISSQSEGRSCAPLSISNYE